MKNVKSEKGVITALVLISMIFLTAFLISSYVIVANKVKTQKEVVEETKRLYDETENIEEIYKNCFGEDTDWIIDNFRQRGILGESETISDETLNKIVQILREETDVKISYLTVSKYLGNEYVLYLYGEIFTDTFVSGQGQANYDARMAIINSLNQNPNITGMLKGDANENGKLDSADSQICMEIAIGYYEYPKYTEDYWFACCYYSIIGDITNDAWIDNSDSSYIDMVLAETMTIESYSESCVNKYDSSLESVYKWLEDELISINL